MGKEEHRMWPSKGSRRGNQRGEIRKNGGYTQDDALRGREPLQRLPNMRAATMLAHQTTAISKGKGKRKRRIPRAEQEEDASTAAAISRALVTLTRSPVYEDRKRTGPRSRRKGNTMNQQRATGGNHWLERADISGFPAYDRELDRHVAPETV